MKYSFFLVFLFLSNYIISQPTSVPKNKFEDAVDFINCRIVELSLKDFKENPKLYDNFKSQFPCDPSNIPVYESIKSFFKSNPGIDKTRILSEEVNKLKTAYNPSWKDPKEAISFLTEDIFKKNQANKVLSNFFEIRKDKGISDFQNELKTELLIILPPIQIDNKEISDLKNQIADLRYDLDNSKSNTDYKITSSLIRVMNIVCLAIIFISVIFLLFRTSKLSSAIRRREKNKPTDFSPYKYIGNESQDLNSYKKEIESKINSAFKKIEIINEDIERLKNIQSAHKSKDETMPIFPSSGGMKEEVFFLPSPNKDGSFNDSDKLLVFKESESLYVFTILQKNRAEFTLTENSSSIKMALNLPDTYIKPVCESSNTFFPGATNIRVTSSGIAFKEMDKWIVTQENKAKIIYV